MNGNSQRFDLEAVSSSVKETYEEHPVIGTLSSLVAGFCLGVWATRLLRDTLAAPQPGYMERIGRTVSDSVGSVGRSMGSVGQMLPSSLRR